MHSVHVVSILSLPSLGQIETEDPRQPKYVPDYASRNIYPMMEQFYEGRKEKIFEKLGISTTELPKTEAEINSNISRIKAELRRQLSAMKPMNYKEARKQEKFTFYTGDYVTHNMENPNRFHRWLPNHRFSSTHLPLVADVFLNFDGCSADWDN